MQKLTGMCEKSYTTDYYRMPGGKFAAYLFLRHGFKATLTVFAVAVCMGVVAVIDLRWVVCALMLVLIALPMLLAFLYINHGLRSFNCANVTLHRLIISGKEIKIEIAKTEQGEAVETVCRILPIETVCSVTAGIDSVVMQLKTPHDEFLWMPHTCFESASDFTEAVGLITQSIRK